MWIDDLVMGSERVGCPASKAALSSGARMAGHDGFDHK
jgi:hypothetical protein